jgi:hypothetical protein
MSINEDTFLLFSVFFREVQQISTCQVCNFQHGPTLLHILIHFPPSHLLYVHELVKTFDKHSFHLAPPPPPPEAVKQIRWETHN